ncbi:MAG: YnbE family lipoprotein [Gammaproteobacteria bacterium]
MSLTLRVFWLCLVATLAFPWIAACTPTVKIEADKPITINMNVKVDQEVTVKVSKDVDSTISKNPNLF